MDIWPTERALKGWIHAKWNPKREIDLQLKSKGFFMVVITVLEDRDRIFEGGPYLFNSAGLYMRYWKENFTPGKEDFTRVPVWIHLYYLPTDYWAPSVLK